ncbi:phenylalanine--tRNA ligase beta subunit-related protein [Roseovarius tibetensis]|uniref:phenylalanine--tRNA ligase beta subunit-related protein n=1 Tax=Roseovarius tibetensis TaxID=2685897 RepID=UPI003D7FC808
MIVIEGSARAVFPDLAVRALRIEGFVAAADAVDMADLEIRVQEAVARREAGEMTWRSAYKRMGLKPSKFLSSVEALSKRAAKTGSGWKTGWKAIDIYNAISIIHGAPLGCYDADALGDADIFIRPVNRDLDRFTPVGGKIDISNGSDDLLVYAVGHEILCWALNHRDSATFCLKAGTRTAVVASESVSPEQHDVSRAAMTELASLLESHGAAVGEIEQSLATETIPSEDSGGHP